MIISITINIILLSLLFACGLYIAHLLDKNKKSEKERLNLAKEASKLGGENVALVGHNVSLIGESLKLRVELKYAQTILVANGIIAPEDEYMDDVRGEIDEMERGL